MGLFTGFLKTNPGNWSGWYSTSGKFFVILFKSIAWSTVADATTFSILTIGLVWGITQLPNSTLIKLLTIFPPSEVYGTDWNTDEWFNLQNFW